MLKSPILALPTAPLHALFMFFLSVESCFPDQHYVVYPFKILLVTGVIAWYWRSLPSLIPSAALLSVAVGIVKVVL